jgi:hypothetical protein
MTAFSRLDQPIPVAFFENFAAATCATERYSLRSLANRVQIITKSRKADLPWLKLAIFGNVRTEKGSLRHDANVLEVNGIEADYDGGKVNTDETVEKLEKAGILAMVYTSPSHTADAPRWRVLCPTSIALPPGRREKLMGRLNGLFQGIFSGESWTLSQAYYFGSVNHNPSHEVHLIDGTPIDEHDDLDEIWTGKPDTSTRTNASGERASGPVDEAALLADIINGTSYHASCVRLLGRWARAGVPYMEVRNRLLAAFDAVFPPDQDARWKMRRADVDRCLEDIYVKQARSKDNAPPPPEPPPEPDDGYYADQEAQAEQEAPGAQRGRRRQANNGAPVEWPEPLDFLADAEMTGAPELNPEHIPEPIGAFVFDTAARMGVDPAAVALAALVSLASVITDDWEIQPKQRDPTWTECYRIWGAIVGDPSIKKSPVVKVTTAPIDRMEAKARERHENAMRRYKSEVKAWKDAGGDPAMEPKQPLLDCFIVEGTTIEALSEVLRDDYKATQRAPARKVLSRHDEMSEFFGNLDRYRAGGNGSGDRGAYLRLYNGGRHTVDRVARGTIAISNWSACFLGGIQPGPIRRIAKESADDGLLQRFCYCVPAGQTRGEDRHPDRAAIERYDALFPALSALTPSMGSFGKPDRVVVLHADAHEYRLDMLDLKEALSAMPDTSDRMKSALGKWDALWARMTLIFHLIGIADANARGVQHDVVYVAKEAAVQATGYLRDILLPHLIRAEAVMFSTEQTGHARWIAGFILSKGRERIADRDIVQAYRPLRAPENRKERLEIMASLEAVGWVRAEVPGDGRQVIAWEVNPKVHATFTEHAKGEREEREATKERIRETVARHMKRGKEAA